MSLENTLLKSLFPYTAKRQARPAESIFDFDVNANIPLGHDLPENGGITGNMPYAADDVSIAAPDERVNVEQIDTSNIVDDRVAIEQALPAPTEVNTPPLVPLGGKRVMGNVPAIDLDRPEFALPYPNPTSMYEQTQNALAQGQFDAQNPRNRDHGFKGALKEALQNFAFGLSHAQPGMGFWESMALGGTGLGMGIADRSSNERREAMRNLPMLQQNAKIASDERDAVQNRLYKGKQIENWQRDDDDRFLSSIRKRKYFDPAKISQVEKDRLASLGYAPEDIGSWDDRDSSKTVKWGDSIFAFNPSTGKYEDAGMGKDPTLKPTEYIVTETNDDGSPKLDANGKPVTKTFITTSKGAANLQEMANFRKAQLRLGNANLEEKKRAGKVREELAQKQFDAAQSQWKQTFDLRKQAEERLQQARQVGDAAEVARLTISLQNAENSLNNMRVNWKKGIGTGGFTAEDYAELTGEQPQ